MTSKTATMAAQQLHRHEPNQSKTRHHDGLAERWLRQANPLECDRTNNRKGCFVITHGTRHLGTEIDRHAYRLGMLAV